MFGSIVVAMVVCAAGGLQLQEDPKPVNDEPTSRDLPLHHPHLDALKTAASSFPCRSEECFQFEEKVEALNRELMSKHPRTGFEGNTDQPGVAVQQTQYIEWAHTRGAKTFCETGFNAGHSALVFLSESSAHVFEFDLGTHAYGRTAQSFLERQYPGRLNVSWGDSRDTIPAFAKAHPDIKCDIIIVDGGHMDDVAKADLTNFAKMAAAGHLLVIDDAPCDADFCMGPTNQWRALKSQGCITTEKQHQLSPRRGFTFGTYTPCPLWPDMVPGRAV